jgi:amino acid adenylation domain-containing protein
VRLSKELSSAVKALSRRENVTLYMTLLAAFQTLLYRYSGQEDVAVGSPIAGRVHAETEGLIGFFVNTLVMRGDLSGKPTFRELLRRVREMTLGAYAHQSLPFEKLVEELAPTRDLARSPLFQVMFALQNAPMSALSLPDLTIDPLLGGATTSNFDLSVSLGEVDGAIGGVFEYNVDLFDASTVDRMADHFRVLLEAIVIDPARRLGDLPLLTVEERRAITAWNAPDATSPPPPAVPRLVEAQAERIPDGTAVACGSERITFRELNEQANRLAHRLRSLGVDREVRVGVCLPRSIPLVVALLGVLKTGGAYVPLDPAYPRERLDVMLEDSQASVVVTQAEVVQKATFSGVQVVCLDRDAADLAQSSPVNPTSPIAGDDLAYVIYTSGSTGTPKGVENRHGGLANLVSWFVHEYGLGPSDRVAQQAVMGFDALGLEVWPALAAGAAVHIADEETRLSPERLGSWFARAGITVAHLPPVLAEPFVEGDLPVGLRLRALLTGSDKVQRRPRRALPFRFTNHYGPTENAILASWGPIEPSDGSEPPPIGRPLSGVQIHVVDDGLEPVPVGVPGELVIGGIGVARGYTRKPDLTAEKFVPDPFAAVPGARLYRTGDLVRRRADGVLDFLGRIDHQVKIRGFRIELGEIETILRQHPAVRAAVVIAREDAPGDKALCAYVVYAASDPGAGELRTFLRARLPDYMVPAFFVALPQLPLSSNGKIDRRLLPAPDRAAVDRTRAFVAPRTPTEETVATVWQSLLRVPRVSVEDDFFELGGHSLVATRVVARLAEELGVDVPVRAIFEARTVAGLAQAADALSLASRADAQATAGVDVAAAGDDADLETGEVE